MVAIDIWLLSTSNEEYNTSLSLSHPTLILRYRKCQLVMLGCVISAYIVLSFYDVGTEGDIGLPPVEGAWLTFISNCPILMLALEVILGYSLVNGDLMY